LKKRPFPLKAYITYTTLPCANALACDKLMGSVTLAAVNAITSAVNAVTSGVRNIANKYRKAVKPAVTIDPQPTMHATPQPSIRAAFQPTV
jgi:hypothetical protein